ncbi:MAG: DUF3494 domain-containing protein [Magnetococcales bacterium]|nr:DUF3494 domain-containing protein [Magnetococcales bacterium]MBF0632259.1 DUF3494 domain-containing protein [Magnetococcales bacterium]
MMNSKKLSKILILSAIFASSLVVSASAFAAGGVMPVSLGKAGTFAILSKAGITNVFRSSVIGDVGTSPITGASLLLTCDEVVGKVYTVTEAGPLPCRIVDPSLLSTAVSDMEAAYTDAAGRNSPNSTELGGGEIGGQNLAPGIYKWSSPVTVSTDLTLTGGPNDVWIFQMAQTFNLANATGVKLVGGALAKNVFWAVAGEVTLGTSSKLKGIVLSETMIAANTGASIEGRLFAQTEVTLQTSTIAQPK